MKSFITTIFILLAAFIMNAANLVIDVRDFNTKENLPLAKIMYECKGQEKKLGTTNPYGKIELKDITYPITITCSYLGYETITKEVSESSISIKNGKGHYSILLQTKINGLNDLVITGQVTPVLATQSIYKVNTISSTQIQQRGATTLNDVLNFETNNFISNDNILGSSVNMGGIGGQNVKILVNGIPIMGRENGNIDLGQINLPNIKRIEMIQGPMSVMYGSNALGGVINLITNTPQKPFSITGRTYIESIGKYNFTGTFSMNRKKQTLQFSLARNFFQGWTPNDSSNDRYQIWKPKTQYTSDLQYSYQLNKNIKFNYFSSYLNETITNKGTPIITPYEGYAFDEYYKTNRSLNSLGSTIKLSSKEDLTLLNSYTIYKRTKNRFRKDLVSLDEYETKSVGDQDTSKFNDINLRGTVTSTRLKNTNLLAGYEYTHETGNSFKLADTFQHLSEIGLFSSVLYQQKKWSFQPSVRYTYNSKYSKAYSPAIHVKYDLTEKIQLRASYAKGFRAPTLKELYLQFIDQNHTIIGNPDLKPEIGDHFEAGINFSKKIKKSNLQLGLTGYYNDIQNLITLAVYNGHGILRKYDNLAHYRNLILNEQAKWSYKNLMIQQGAGFTYVYASQIVPQHTLLELSTNISYLIKPINATINFNYKYNSKQPVLTVEDKYLFTAPLHIGNFSVQKSFFKNYLQAQMGIKNLFNIQSTTLSGATDLQGSAHTSASGMQVFPARSIFFNFIYSL